MHFAHTCILKPLLDVYPLGVHIREENTGGEPGFALSGYVRRKVGG